MRACVLSVGIGVTDGREREIMCVCVCVALVGSDASALIPFMQILTVLPEEV